MEEKYELSPELKQKFKEMLDLEQIENITGGTGERVVLCPKDNSRMRYDSKTGTWTCIFGHTWF